MPKRNNSLARVVIIITGCIFAALVSPSARSQAKGSVAGTILNGVEKPWLGLDLTFYDDKMRFEASATTTVDGKYRVDLPVGTHVLVASVVSHGDHEEFKLVFVVLPNTQTPGDVNFKTFDPRTQRCRNISSTATEICLSLKKSREQMTKLQAEIDQAGDRAIGELRKALSTTDEEDSFFQRSGILRRSATRMTPWGNTLCGSRLSTSPRPPARRNRFRRPEQRSREIRQIRGSCGSVQKKRAARSVPCRQSLSRPSDQPLQRAALYGRDCACSQCH